MLGEGSSALRRLQFAGVVVDQFESRAAVPAVTVEDSGHCWELASRSAPATPSVTCDEKAGGTTAGPHGRKLLPLQAAVSAHARPHSAESAVCAAPRPSWPMASPPPLEEEEEQAASSSSPSSARCPVSTPSPRARCHSPSVEDAAAAGHTLASLPADVLTEVGGFLPVEEYGAFAGVCTHTAREVAPALWRTVRGVAVSHSLLHGRELSRLLQRCPSLHALDLRSADFVHGSSFRAFLREPGTARLRRLHLPPSTPRAALEDGLPTLLAGVSTLGLRRVDAFSDAVVQAERLPVSTSLRALDARQCWRLTDQGVGTLLLHSPQMEHLLLSRCGGITDRSLHLIARHCTGLRTLDVSGEAGRVSADAIAHVGRACPRVTTLSLSWSRMTDTDLRVALAPYASLKELRLESMAAVTTAGICAALGAGGRREGPTIVLRDCERVDAAAVVADLTRRGASPTVWAGGRRVEAPAVEAVSPQRAQSPVVATRSVCVSGHAQRPPQARVHGRRQRQSPAPVPAPSPPAARPVEVAGPQRGPALATAALNAALGGRYFSSLHQGSA